MSEAARQKVLIVYDDPAQTRILQRSLEGAGFQVFSTARGDWAAAMLSQVLPDLLLLDWDIPGLSSLALTRMIRADARFTRLPILMVGRNIRSENKILALEAGADLCLDGGISPRELTARVRALLRRARLLQESHHTLP